VIAPRSAGQPLQIPDASSGHGIAVSNTDIATDLTPGKVVQEASFARGNELRHARRRLLFAERELDVDWTETRHSDP